MRRALVALLSLLCLAPAVAGAEDAATPEAVLERYLDAVQREDFSAAYDVVSKAMKTDRKSGAIKSREVWSKEAQYVMQLSEAKIFEFEVFPGKIEGEEAKVPNLLSSQDKFLNQLGVDEYELYTLVREDGQWKVDRQEEVVGRAEIAKWFPKEKAEPEKKKEAAP